MFSVKNHKIQGLQKYVSDKKIGSIMYFWLVKNICAFNWLMFQGGTGRTVNDVVFLRMLQVQHA